MADITTACRDINQLNPLAQKACKLFMTECEKAGVKIFITETYRPQERQNYLYAQGRTRAGSIVTYTTSSNHTGRMAWDVACSPPQKLYDASVLQKAGVVANKLGIRWGGSCFGTFKDSPHFEILASWKEPVVKEDDLKIAVKEIAKKVKITESSWNDVSKMNMIYAERLVALMGETLYGANTYLDTVKVLKGEGIINSEDIWGKKQFRPEFVKALLIKIADDITKNKK